MNFDILESRIKQRLADLHALYLKRREAILEASTRGGTQGEATQSASGWHAPHDGWVCPDTGDVYGKGQWVPLPRDDWYCKFADEPYPQTKYKVRIEAHQQSRLRDICKAGCDVSFGNSWVSGGLYWCYAYLTGYEPIMRVIEQFTIEQTEAARAAEKAAKGVAPEGRVEVEGIVLTCRDCGDMFGSIKMCVKLDNGATVYGTRPASLDSDERINGKRVRFTATFQHAKDDNTHSYFKRPTHGEFVTTSEV